MKLLRYLLVVLIVAVVAVASFSPGKALTSSLVEITGFGQNPSSLRMFIYIPTTVKPNPPILVAVHWCHGDGQAMFNGTQYAAMADQYGYIVIYPSVTQASDGCFDVASSAALTHNGGSDPVGIMSMITYAEQHYNGDPNRVYVTGISSGAMMTEVLLGDYPDVFKAGVAFAGVPFGCFAVNPDALRWSSACATGTVTHTPQEWGDIVRAAYPGYTGPRPRVQLWHGTNDEVLSYINFGEAIKQWTNVHGISQTPTSTDSPAPGQTRTRYTNSSGTVLVEAISMQGVSHNLPVDAAAAVHFFGLDGSVTPTSVPPTGVPPTGVPPTGVPPAGISINSGGPATGSFLADQYFSGGSTYTNTRTIDVSQIPANTAPAAIFSTERYGAVTYTVPNRSGAQMVTLYFAETYVTAAGQRVFNVSINGTTVLSRFDIFASAGGANRAIARSFNTTANPSGQLVIQLTAVTQNPKINGITVTSGISPTSVPPTNVPPTGVPPTGVPPTSVPPTGVPPTSVPPTSNPNTPCSPVTSTISVPFTFDGAGTYCWQMSNLGAYINSWNLVRLTVNGVDFTNRWVGSGSYPPAIGGFWYVGYTGNFGWSHFEIR